MKKLLSILLIFTSVFFLFGCDILTANNKTVTVTRKESVIDVQSIKNQIYSEVYEMIEAELRLEIKEDILKEYEDSITIDTLQDKIYSLVSECSNGNVLVSNLKNNQNSELVTYATGSGVIYEKEELTSGDYSYRYYLITNEHVVNGGKAYKISFGDETEIPATLVGADETTDIAVLYFDSNNEYTVVKLGDSDKTKVGEIVVAIGNPKGESLFGSVTMGIVGGLNRNLIESGTNGNTKNTINSYIQHDAAINSGNSGGGLFNLNKECIGINSVKYASSDIEGLNFSIPINLVKEVASDLREYGEYYGTVSLGISVTEIKNLTNSGRETYNIPANMTDGVLVMEVDSTKSSAGILETGDIIIEIDNTAITKTTDISVILKAHRIGDTIEVKVLRSNTETTLSITFKRPVKSETSE